MYTYLKASPLVMFKWKYEKLKKQLKQLKQNYKDVPAARGNTSKYWLTFDIETMFKNSTYTQHGHPKLLGQWNNLKFEVVRVWFN